MPAPTNTVQTYALKGLREDLSDVIYNIAPEDTPFLSACKKVKATGTLSEWQTDTLRASGTNAHVEGDDTTATPRSATVRLGNYTQIFKDAVITSGTADAVDAAGRAKEMAYQIVKASKEHKLDIEKALFDNQAKVGGTTTTARRLAGAVAFIATNVEMGATGVNPAGDGSNARTDGTARAFTQVLFDSAMEKAWLQGGKVDTVYLSSKQMGIALGFNGNNNQRNTTKRNEVTKLLDVYMTPWGTVEFVPSRENRAKDVLLVQSDKWQVAQLRATKNEPLAKTGDSEKRQIITELTLVACNEKASALVTDCS